MSATPFHPLIDTWFRERFGAPTEPQQCAWPEIAAGRHTLIAAPTGSGKTLAAFLVCIDRLLRQALAGDLPDRTQVVYVSPLKALSNDIRRNLELPLAEIERAAAAAGHLIPPIRAMVRTGDTPARERALMLKYPPHILVTTPESLYVLLTAAKSRERLASVDTVIVDEIHALARDKRGTHLSLSLERLERLCAAPPVRIGLSATQKPIDEIARFLVGTNRVAADASAMPADASSRSTLDCRIIDSGHLRRLDLNIEIPQGEVAAVCSNEQWARVDERMAELIAQHRSTLIFVNTRRMAERVSHRLRARLGEDAVASHHGSLSREIRLGVEERLMSGALKAIVATASLELGIDVGFIDLVCQLGSPRSIAVFLQRVGRSGHRLGVVPKGRLFALTRDELLEGLALLRAVRHGRLDRVEMPAAPLDILAQQIVAEVASRDWDEDALFALCRSAWPYRDLPRAEFDRIVAMLSEGIVPGRKDGAFLHRDAVHRRLRARRHARLTALTCGGAIPETGDYRVVTEDEDTFVGSVNEDFAIESMAGDVFLLGNTSWRIRYVRGGQVVVRDANGAAATVPFWLGEAPGRTIELSEELSRLREEAAQRIETGAEGRLNGGVNGGVDGGVDAATGWLREECGVDDATARQAATYVAAQLAAVGFVPTQARVLFERFFDESGGMQLVVHAPFGSRINRAWGLAMRKRFCRTFDFELQASADDNGIVLSLGPQHSFPLAQMFELVRPEQARDHLVQALLAAPMFKVRWRWNATRALAVLRSRGGKKVPPPLQRFKADDLLTAVFPAQTACFEHRPPDLPVPDHPLVQQTVFDCLHEAMDIDGWERLLEDVRAGRVQLEARDTREPSPFSHAILNANPYAFLDDAPLEERRARAVAARRTLSIDDMRDLARLDPDAIARVQAEAWPVVRDAEELHDALLSLGALPAAEGAPWQRFFGQLVTEGRAAEVHRLSDETSTSPAPALPPLWTAAERWPLVRAAFAEAVARPALVLPEALEQAIEPSAAVTALVRGRLEIVGPVTAQALADALGLARSAVDIALAALEAEGVAIQGRFTSASTAAGAVDADERLEWCERRLLARIHRLTLDGARKRVQPVSPETYWRFLSEFHRVVPGTRRDGFQGLCEAVAQLQGVEIAGAAWEADILPGRVAQYQPEWLDRLAFSGELVWGRLRRPQKADARPSKVELPDDESPKASAEASIAEASIKEGTMTEGATQEGAAKDDASAGGLTRVVPIALMLRPNVPWLFAASPPGVALNASAEAQTVHAALQERGALFFDELQAMTGLLPSRLEDALSQLAALGCVTADGFAAVRGLAQRAKHRSRGPSPFGHGGRWTLLPGRLAPSTPEERLTQWARQLLRRYGVVFRDLLAREAAAPSWWELVPAYRRLEARGELRGGRFVAGVAGEQYALPEAVDLLRRARDDRPQPVIIAATDPLNLTGLVTPGPRVPAHAGNRLLFHNGRLVAALQGGQMQCAPELRAGVRDQVVHALRLQALPLREQILKELPATTSVTVEAPPLALSPATSPTQPEWFDGGGP
jgi:ATP-dependent Lhr-like helicase